MSTIDVAFVLLALVLVTALAARRTSVPAPVVFAAVGIAGGAAWHLVPALPPVRMPPDLVLFAFLPPLLMTAAYALPLQAFRRNLLPIVLLAVGLVLATMGVAAVVGHALVGLSWAAAFVLGTIIAPPDPVAATSVASKTGLPHRLVVILEGEGLVNDAVAIVAYGIAVEALVSGLFAWDTVFWSLLRETPTGILIGLLIGGAAALVRRYADSVPLEVGISLVTPYLAYHLAERFGCSGVLAVVTLGFMLRWSSFRVSSPVARLAARTVWSFLRYASTALVFLLLGLLIGEIAVDWPSREVVIAGVILSGAIVAIRIVWMLLVPRLVAALGASQTAKSSTAEQIVIGWAGMRGVVSLALALALPLNLPINLGGSDQTRNMIVFLTLVVIIVTLIVQGATLMPLVRWLKAGDPKREHREERHARLKARRAGVAAIRAANNMTAGFDQAARQILIKEIDEGTRGIAVAGEGGTSHHSNWVLLQALDAQRDVVNRLRDAGRLSGELAERLDTELDLDAMSSCGGGTRLTDGGGD
ncbi:MAG: sodium:proton antiporter [Glaciimonas sp.]|nr:sodium:proton antiporter [Glaciimonas sp.]